MESLGDGIHLTLIFENISQFPQALNSPGCDFHITAGTVGQTVERRTNTESERQRLSYSYTSNVCSTSAIDVVTQLGRTMHATILGGRFDSHAVGDYHSNDTCAQQVLWPEPYLPWQESSSLTL